MIFFVDFGKKIIHVFHKVLSLWFPSGKLSNITTVLFLNLMWKALSHSVSPFFQSEAKSICYLLMDFMIKFFNEKILKLQILIDQKSLIILKMAIKTHLCFKLIPYIAQKIKIKIRCGAQKFKNKKI